MITTNIISISKYFSLVTVNSRKIVLPTKLAPNWIVKRVSRIMTSIIQMKFVQRMKMDLNQSVTRIIKRAKIGIIEMSNYLSLVIIK